MAVVVCFRLFGYTGHFGYDDMQYAEIAADALHGEVDYDDHFCYRSTLVWSTMLSYRLFGVNDFASSLPAMLMTVLMLVVIYLLLRKHGLWPTAIGLVLAVSSHWFLFYSNKLMPDIYVAFFTMLAAYIYYRYRYVSDGHTTAIHAAVFALSLMLAFMSKGTVVLLIPWLLYLFINDCWHRRKPLFWLYGIGFGAVFMAVYLVGTKMLTGEFLYRFKAIAQNSYLNRCSYDQQPLGVLLRRLFFDFFNMTILNGLAVPLVIVAASFVSRGWRRMFAMSDGRSYFCVSALVLLLSANLMTISGKAYIPMCVDPRHYLFLIPVSATAAALLLSDGKLTRRQVCAVAVLMGLLTVYSYFGNRDFCLNIYLPMTFVAIVSAALWNTRFPRWGMACALLVAALIWPVRCMADQSYHYSERRDALMANVVHNDALGLVLSDAVGSRLMRYYDGFAANGRYVAFDEVADTVVRAQSGSVGLVLDSYSMAMSSLSADDLPDYAKVVSATQRPLFEGYGARVYVVDSLVSATHIFDTLCYSINCFDGDIPEYWNGDSRASEKTSCSGAYSQEVRRYSSTFAYALDSLHLSGYDTLLVCVQANCNCMGPTDCAVVVTVESVDSTYFWNSWGIDGRVRAYSHWFQFDCTQELHLGELPSDAVLKVYFYKHDRAKVYIDDFEVSLCRKTPRH